jgi:hypothetical protein
MRGGLLSFDLYDGQEEWAFEVSRPFATFFPALSRDFLIFLALVLASQRLHAVDLALCE